MLKINPQHVEFTISDEAREILEDYGYHSNYGIELHEGNKVRIFNGSIYWAIMGFNDLNIFLPDDIYRELVRLSGGV